MFDGVSEPTSEMRYVVLALLGGTVGGLAGWLLGSRGSLIASLAASILGALAGSVVAAGAWLLRPPAGVEVLAVSIGVTEALLSTSIIVVGAMLVHFGMEILLADTARLLSFRPVFLGAAAGVVAVASFAFGAAVRGVR